jgi:hypothetical protein
MGNIYTWRKICTKRSQLFVQGNTDTNRSDGESKVKDTRLIASFDLPMLATKLSPPNITETPPAREIIF